MVEQSTDATGWASPRAPWGVVYLHPTAQQLGISATKTPVAKHIAYVHFWFRKAVYERRSITKIR